MADAASVVVKLQSALAEAQAVASPPDVTPPETVITSGPTSSTSTTATIAFTGSDNAPGALTYERSLDGGPYLPAVSPETVSGLAVGPHTYWVRAKDPAGNVDLTPAAWTWNVNAPSSVLTLVRRSPANKGVEWGGYNTQFNIGVVVDGGKLYHEWNGTWLYDIATWGPPQLLAVTNADGTTPTTRPENCGMAFVPSLGAVYETSGAPVGPARRFDLASRVYTKLNTNEEGDVSLLLDAPRNRLISVGGYTPPVDVRAFALPSGPWTVLPIGNLPLATFDYAKLSMYRACMSSTSRMGFFGDANELSEIDLGAGETQFTWRPTTGTKPPLYSMFVYYEPLDVYFAWCGANAVSGTHTPKVCKLYVLYRSTWVWSELPYALAAGETLGPASQAQAGNILVADPARQQLILMIADGPMELWSLDLRGFP